MFFTPEPIVTPVRLVQLLNALSAILVIVSGIITLAIFLLPLKIVPKLTTSLSSKEFGIVTVPPPPLYLVRLIVSSSRTTYSQSPSTAALAVMLALSVNVPSGSIAAEPKSIAADIAKLNNRFFFI